MVLKGIFPAVVTAYDDNGDVSTERLEKLYSFLAESSVDGVFIGGSTGEWPLLTMDERILEAKIAVETLDGRKPVLMHISSLIPDEVIRYGKWAKENGVAAVSIVMPYYFLYREEGLMDYFSKILPYIELPVYLYNIPGNVRNVLTPSFMCRLSERFENIAGVKDSSMDFLRLQEFISAPASRKLNFFTGNDAQIIFAYLAGANGAISAAAGAFPRFVTGMFRDVLEGRMQDAVKKQESIQRYRQFVVSHAPMSVVKCALEIQGIKVGPPRAPLNGLNSKERSELEKLIEKEELLNV